MSRWLDAARAATPELFPDDDVAVPCAVSANSAVRRKTAISVVPIGMAPTADYDGFCANRSDTEAIGTEKTAENCLTAQTALLAHGTEGQNTPDNVVCIFCGEPVERGTPGTGALAGDDLHLDCYRKRYPQGHLHGERK